jgi:hypothetical protein
VRHGRDSNTLTYVNSHHLTAEVSQCAVFRCPSTSNWRSKTQWEASIQVKAGEAACGFMKRLRSLGVLVRVTTTGHWCRLSLASDRGASSQLSLIERGVKTCGRDCISRCKPRPKRAQAHGAAKLHCAEASGWGPGHAGCNLMVSLDPMEAKGQFLTH